MSYVDLHLHSTFSFLDGYGSAEQILGKAKSLNRNAVAITDHGNISAHAKLERCDKDIKLLYGCEFYLVPSVEQNARKKFHITVIAKNESGYENLLHLVSKSWENFIISLL